MSPFGLIVTNNNQSEETLREEFAELGHDYFLVVSAAKGLAQFVERPPDIAFLNVESLDAEGSRDCLLRIRTTWPATGTAQRSASRELTSSSCRHVPILVICSSEQARHFSDYLSAGADDYIVKPYVAGELAARVQRLRTRCESQHQDLTQRDAFQHSDGDIAHATLHRQMSAQTTAPAPTNAATDANQERSGLPPKILIVDDSISNICTLVQFLKAEYKTLVATNGHTALALAAREQPDLILLDVVMADMNGHEVCSRLKEVPATRSIPVIFLTGRDEDDDEMTGFELGAVDYITKPFSLPVVRERIRTHVELKRCHDQLQRQSLLDGLTGIANRRSFDTFLSMNWAHAMRQRLSISVLMIDIDYFKAYNDHYGHVMGDECLKTVARALQGVVLRDTDMLARYGGEEFVCVLVGTDHAGARNVAQQMQVAVKECAVTYTHSPVADHVTFSLGLASMVPEFGTDARYLLEAADRALYVAKESGRNRVMDEPRMCR